MTGVTKGLHARAGDLARIDGEGCVYRAERGTGIIPGAENVHPVEIRSILAPVGPIRRLDGASDERWGEAAGSVVVASHGAIGHPDDLRLFCATRLAKYKVPKRIWLREEMPFTACGNTLKCVLREGLATAVEAS